MSKLLETKDANLAAHIRGKSFEEVRRLLKTKVEKEQFDVCLAKAIQTVNKKAPGKSDENKYKVCLILAKSYLARYQLQSGLVEKRRSSKVNK